MTNCNSLLWRFRKFLIHPNSSMLGNASDIFMKSGCQQFLRRMMRKHILDVLRIHSIPFFCAPGKNRTLLLLIYSQRPDHPPDTLWLSPESNWRPMFFRHVLYLLSYTAIGTPSTNRTLTNRFGICCATTTLRVYGRISVSTSGAFLLPS